MALARRDEAHHTYGDYESWPEQCRYELIAGVAYSMAPAPSRIHQEVVGEIFVQVASALRGRPCRAFVAPFDVRLPKGDEADAFVETVVQPDVLVICDPSKLDDRGARGAPDWVAEVLSPATAAHDQTVKLAAYERAGVREVWLVHPVDRVVAIYRLADGRYERPAIREAVGSLAIGVLENVGIDWDLAFSAL